MNGVGSVGSGTEGMSRLEPVHICSMQLVNGVSKWTAKNKMWALRHFKVKQRRKSGQRSYEEFYNIISHFLPGFESVS